MRPRIHRKRRAAKEALVSAVAVNRKLKDAGVLGWRQEHMPGKPAAGIQHPLPRGSSLPIYPGRKGKVLCIGDPIRQFNIAVRAVKVHAASLPALLIPLDSAKDLSMKSVIRDVERRAFFILAERIAQQQRSCRLLQHGYVKRFGSLCFTARNLSGQRNLASPPRQQDDSAYLPPI